MVILLTALALSISAHSDPRWKIVQPYDNKLERIAKCESHKHWFIDTGNGFFGGLQFKLSTWQSVGGHGYPNKNSELEQKYRAVILIKKNGYSPWPICGYA
jgi:Transglycosylase-like domain